MQLVVTSAEKLNLYNVCNDQNWVEIIDTDLRRKLLNEEYEISTSTETVLGKSCVISFKKGVVSTNIEIQDEVMILEMSEEDGVNFITKSINEIGKNLNQIKFDGTDINTQDNIIPIKSKEYIEEITGAKEVTTSDKVLTPPYKITPDELVTSVAETESKNYDKVNSSRNIEILFGVNQKNNK